MMSKKKAYNNYADYLYRSMILYVITSEKLLNEPALFLKLMQRIY